MPVVSHELLVGSEHLLRRAHHTLAFLLHFYVNSLPPTTPVAIPRSLAFPMLRVSEELQLPPVLTYSDNVLYNWRLTEEPAQDTTNAHSRSRSDDYNPFGLVPADEDAFFLSAPDDNPFGLVSSDPVEPGSPLLSSSSTSAPRLPTLSTVTSIHTFSGTRSEDVFYLASQRTELLGARALSLMQSTLDELFLSDALAFRRITRYLSLLSGVIADISGAIQGVRDGCDPREFYEEIRPWFHGQQPGREWVWELSEEEKETIKISKDLKGPSAGQSALIHALDVFLGLDNCAHRERGEGSTDEKNDPGALLRDMQKYMPRHHRAFLRHLSASPRPLRDAVEARVETVRLAVDALNEEKKDAEELLDAYNNAVSAVKAMRDAHIRIVATYIIGPAARARERARALEEGRVEDAAGHVDTAEQENGKLKGTGGTDLVRFLKGVRDQTARAVIVGEKR